jgi:AhpD family alkylhydroperoxidase
MARLPLIDPEGDSPAAAMLSRIAGERGRAFNVYRLFANSAGVLDRMYGFASYLWSESALDPALIELTTLRVAQLTESDYEWARHRGLAERSGVSRAEIEALAAWITSEGIFTPEQRAALQLTEEVTLGVEAGEETVQLVRDLLGERATLELTVLIAFYGMVARLLRSFAVDPEPGDESIFG